MNYLTIDMAVEKYVSLMKSRHILGLSRVTSCQRVGIAPGSYGQTVRRSMKHLLSLSLNYVRGDNVSEKLADSRCEGKASRQDKI